MYCTENKTNLENYDNTQLPRPVHQFPANSAVSRSKLQDLMPVYFHLWELQAVTIHLLLKQWRDSSERSRERWAFKEHSERLKGCVAELEKKLYDSRNEVNRVTTELGESEPEINRLMKQVQELQLQNKKLQSAHNEVCVRQSARSCSW